MSRATLGFSRVTRARTRQNPYPRPRARVFVHTGRGFTKTRGYPNPCTGLPPEMTNEPRKGSAGVNRHCRAALRGSVSQRNGNRGAEHAPQCSTLWRLMLEIVDRLVDVVLMMRRQYGIGFSLVSLSSGHSHGVDLQGRVHWWGSTLWGMMWHGAVVIVSRQK